MNLHGIVTAPDSAGNVARSLRALACQLELAPPTMPIALVVSDACDVWIVGPDEEGSDGMDDGVRVAVEIIRHRAGVKLAQGDAFPRGRKFEARVPSAVELAREVA